MSGLAQLIQDIQYMIAPAVMVSSAALLLLGLQTKFSNLANRFRVLQHEARLLTAKTPRQPGEDQRLRNLQQQVAGLVARARYVKASIILAYTAIICFTAASVLIFLSVYTAVRLETAVLAIFVAGFLCVLLTAALSIAETQRSYQVLMLERRSSPE